MTDSQISLISAAMSVIAAMAAIGSIIASVRIHYNQLKYETKPYITCTQKTQKFEEIPVSFFDSYENIGMKNFTYEIKDQVIHLTNHNAYFRGYIIDNVFHLSTSPTFLDNNGNFMLCPFEFFSENNNISKMQIYVVLQGVLGHYYKYQISYSPKFTKNRNHYVLDFINIGLPEKISKSKINKFYSEINKQTFRKINDISNDNSLDW